MDWTSVYHQDPDTHLLLTRIPKKRFHLPKLPLSTLPTAIMYATTTFLSSKANLLSSSLCRTTLSC
jgi:hypothetical protein